MRRHSKNLSEAEEGMQVDIYHLSDPIPLLVRFGPMLNLSIPKRNDVRYVVVILAPSRTGSSFLFRALTSCGNFLAPQGEETPHYRRAGLGVFQDIGYSDVISSPPPEETLEAIGASLLREIGIKTDSGFSKLDYYERCLDRFEMQWPQINSLNCRLKLREVLNHKFELLPPGYTQWNQFYLDWIEQLEKEGLPVQRNLYSTSGPHPDELPMLEDPPYIAAEPRIPVTKELLSRLPILLKTSSNIYRLPLLRSLFPKAQFKWIILQRNPAGTINALMDGWLSSGFHSQDLHPNCTLKIRSYSARVRGGQRFWKFDMPPGWQSHIGSDLSEVCAFQWYSASQTIENLASRLKEPSLRIRYEDLLSRELQPKIIDEVLSFAGVSRRNDISWSSNDPVTTVNRPAAGKWKARSSILTPLLQEFANGDLLDLAQKLQYDFKTLENWA
ncbi:MAG: hypothetical protein IPJ71_04770 [Bdellovibrionales bacterium]|nr:hypothetical protein [Bdellovibrionales bacterium]